jgi:TPR repeat protein
MASNAGTRIALRIPPLLEQVTTTMANREELGLIRGARGGRPEAQLALGRLYLYGSAGLPKSLPTALHWLDRAAQQGCGQACELIGSHIPVELALQSARPLVQWYEQAYDAGVLRAGVVLAQLTLEQQGGPGADPARRAKALRALESAARAGVPDAQWLYARYQGGGAAAGKPQSLPEHKEVGERWPRRASPNPLDSLWQAGEHQRYLERALPLARALAQGANGGAPASLAPEEVRLLARCAQALSAAPDGGGVAAADILRLWELAANENEPHAQMAVGLWQARMRIDGKRIAVGPGSANFKKAIRWLALAGEQGLAEAWYALSRIYIKPEFSQRNVGDAQRYLERAAEMGYRDAQFECGANAWRARRENESNDVRAVYWLQKAAAQGCPQAAASLLKIAPRGGLDGFAALVAQAPAGVAAGHPLLAARLRLAVLFRLSRAEALLLDVRAADQGHCLVIDIRGSYGRSKRRLVAIASVQERRALDEIVQQFGSADSGLAGPEGNYRQRLYRLKTVLPTADDGEPPVYELAA